MDNAIQLTLSGNRIGVITEDRVAWVKEGGLGASWVKEVDNAIQLTLSGNRIGVITEDRVAWVKEGGLDASWVREMNNAIQLALSENRIGVITEDKVVWIKEGGLGASWVRGAKRFVKFEVFKELNLRKQVIDDLKALAQVAAGDNSTFKVDAVQKIIERWRKSPFRPFAIARGRHIAFLWRTLFAYLDNLFAWADSLYRRDTHESINEATMLYVLARKILGRRPQVREGKSKRQAYTYTELAGKWDDFANAWIDIGGRVQNQTGRTTSRERSEEPSPISKGMLYFCKPFNDKILSYWHTIDDRFFNLRHCRNIEGIERDLPFTDAPIDPELLVRATAAGLDLADAISGLYAPPPHYRYSILSARASELVSEAKALGAAMLSAIEKRDAEHLANLRSTNEISLLKLVGEVRKLQITEAESNIEALRASRKSIGTRYGQYQRLLGKKDIKVPIEGESVGEESMLGSVDAGIASNGSNLGLIKEENEQYLGLEGANTWSIAASISKTTGGGLHALSAILEAFGKPTGAKISTAFASGASAVGDAFSMVSQGWRNYAEQQGMIAGHLRRRDEWAFQSNQTLKELQQIDKQILANQIRVKITKRELDNHIEQIEQAQALDEYMRGKFSNEQLYQWMFTQLSGLYFSTYHMALGMAFRAEGAAERELGVDPLNIIRRDSWNSLREGLLAGERLTHDLKRLELAYLDRNRRELEITKHISLRQINPLALLALRETGQCEFNLPEMLYDMDFPGHYKRRIKTVSITIPCIAGPYTGLNATLRLLRHEYRKTSTGSYAKNQDGDDRFVSSHIPSTAIAVSTGQNDSGLFEFNFRDERYLPFEGAGAISIWRLELPSFRQFDYDSISDAVIHLRYTAVEGGDRLKKAATDAVQEFIKANEELSQQEGLFAVIDLKHDLPTEWHKAMQVKAGDAERTFVIPQVQDFLPFYVLMDKDGKPRAMDKIKVTDVVLVTSADLPASDLFVVQDGTEIAFGAAAPVGSTKTFAIRDEEIKVGDWALAIKNVDKAIDKAMLVLRFILK